MATTTIGLISKHPSFSFSTFDRSRQLFDLPNSAFTATTYHQSKSSGKLTAVTAALPTSVCENSKSQISSFKELIESLINGFDLSESEAEASLDLLLTEKNDALICAFLVLLRAKGETIEEIVGLTRAMLNNATKVEGLDDVVDIVGTSGDGANTVTFQLALQYLLQLVVQELPSKEVVLVLLHVEVLMC